MIRYGKGVNNSDTLKKAETLVEALPYLRKFHGKCIVVKIGGELLLEKESLTAFAQDIALLNSVGIHTVVCHGGGPQISSLMSSLGIEPEFVEGQRVTDEKTLELTSYVLLGKVNSQIVSVINSLSSQAIGVSGVSGGILTVSPLNEKLGFVGKITRVRTAPLLKLLESNYIPVVSSIGADEHGQNYNVNADMAAGEIARALGAEKLVMLTNTEGIYENFESKEKLISEVDAETLSGLREQGHFVGGIVPKIDAVLTALKGGVARAHIIDGRTAHALLLEFFTQEGIGTMVFP